MLVSLGKENNTLFSLLESGSTSCRVGASDVLYFSSVHWRRALETSDHPT
jgi:hypothetical protein